MKERPELIPEQLLDDPLYTTSAVAKMVGVTTETVRNWINTGKLDAIMFRTGQSKRAQIRIKRSVLLAFLNTKY